MNTFAPKTMDRIIIIDPNDPAIDKEQSDIAKYMETLDRSFLSLIGEPIQYVFAPPNRRTMDHVVAEFIDGGSNMAIAYAFFAALICEIINGENATAENKMAMMKVRRDGLSRLPDKAPIWDVLSSTTVFNVGSLLYMHLLVDDPSKNS